MARNTDKYAYVEVSLRKGSWLYKLLSADAVDGGISLADAIKARLIVACQGVSLPVSNFPQVERLAERRPDTNASQKSSRKQDREIAPASSEVRENPEEAPSFDFSKALASADLFDQFG